MQYSVLTSSHHGPQSCHTASNLQGLPQETEASQQITLSERSKGKLLNLFCITHVFLKAQFMNLHGTKTGPEFCFTAYAWKSYPVPAQILHTSYEAQECQDAYPANVSHWKKLLTLRIMEYQFLRKLSSSSGGKIWNHLETGDHLIVMKITWYLIALDLQGNIMIIVVDCSDNLFQGQPCACPT